MHVGVAKTGTTYLQRILHAHRDQLKAAGLLYPGKRAGDHYVASVDLRRLEAEKFEHLKSDGSWDRLAADVRAFEGNAIVSHETFARCSTAEVRRVIESCGNADVKVVLTVRDLGRQIPAVWQETLKNRATSGYGEFLDDVFVNVDSGAHKVFWKPQDVSKVVKRWGRQVGMDNVTIVTVPPSGAPRDELWKRFAAAIELPDVPVSLPEAAANTSLGPAEAELLRHVNIALPTDYSWARYLRLVKRQFAEQRLASRSTTRIVVPERWYDAVQARNRMTTRYLQEAGCRVIGDLSDLSPQPSSQAGPGPDDLSREELLTVAGEVVRDLVLTPLSRRPTVVDDDPPTGGDRLRASAAAVRRRLWRGRD